MYSYKKCFEYNFIHNYSAGQNFWNTTEIFHGIPRTLCEKRLDEAENFNICSSYLDNITDRKSFEKSISMIVLWGYKNDTALDT